MSNNTKRIDPLLKIDFQIFDSIQEPLSIFELIHDEKGNIIDLKALYINSKSELNYIQKRSVIAKKISELYDRDVVNHYLKIVKEIISTGKSKRYETYFSPLDKYYLVLNFVYEDLYISLSLDISKQKKHEKHLKESENRYHALFRNNYAAMLLINPETGNIIDANPAACSFYGYKKEELLKMKIMDLNILTDEQIFREMQKARAEKKNHFVFRHRLASGEIRDVDTYSGPITVGGKKLLYSIVHDITRQKKAEEALKNERELLQAIVDTIPVMITIYDPHVEHMRVNKAFEEITGWTNEEIQHLNVMEAIYPDLDYRLKAAEFMKSLSGWKDFTMTIKDGSKIESSWANVQIPDGRQVGIGIDIRERKKLENELKQSMDHLEEQVKERTAELEESYKSLKESELKAKEQADLLDITHEAIFVRDINDKISFWNNGAEELYGWTKKEAIGKTLHELLQTEYPEPLEEIKNKALSRGRWDGELTHTQRDGTKINVLSRWSLQKDNLNNPVGFMEVNTDITESKLAEIERENLIKDLKRSNEELRQFAYITSHDLQEPLRTMSSYAGLLKHRYEGQLDQDADDFIEFMVSDAARMKAMIQGLLDYSRIGTRGKKFENFNSGEAFKNALYDLASSIKENNVEITYDKLPVIYADKDQIARVFQNLIENAIKFRKKDETPRIHVSAQKKDNEYVFSVSDNSIGMEPEYTDKIFEIFKRLHAIGEYEGAGIGLAIVKRIINGHRGHVWVKSELGKGSTFYFTIPANYTPKN
ncbi:MAG: PAS domain S-box protein [Methanobacterium sp.]